MKWRGVSCSRSDFESDRESHLRQRGLRPSDQRNVRSEPKRILAAKAGYFRNPVFRGISLYIRIGSDGAFTLRAFFHTRSMAIDDCVDPRGSVPGLESSYRMRG